MQGLNVIGEVISSLASGIGTAFTSIVNSIVAVFWSTGSDGAFGTPTVLGVFALIGLAIWVLRLGVNFVVSFVRTRGR